MPLVVVTGPPCTGKSIFAKAFEAYLARGIAEGALAPPGGAGHKVCLTSDETLGIDKRAGYKNATAEKLSRGAFKGAVERSFNASSTLVADGLNYIKGYRYELFCSVRAQATTHAVVQVMAPQEQAEAWNAARGEAGYEGEVASDLWSRYEAPDERNRWDSPLFRLTEDDVADILDSGLLPVASGAGSSSATEGGGGGRASSAAGGAGGVAASTASAAGARERTEALFRSIAAALYERAGLKPLMATAPQKAAPSDLVNELDRRTSEVVAALGKALAPGAEAAPGVGASIPVPHSSTPVILARKTTLPELKRHKKTFDKAEVNRLSSTAVGGTGLVDVSAALAATGTRFVEFINAQLRMPLGAAAGVSAFD